MKVQINLSRRPFYNRRLFWLSFGAMMILLTFFVRWTIARIAETDVTTARLEKEVASEKSQLEQLQKTFTSSAPQIPEDQARQIQAAALLIKQRKFSWTGLLEEFEREMPPTIRVASISLRDNTKDKTLDSNLGLHIRIFAKSVDDITKMIAAADKRGVFRIQPLSQQAGQNGDIGFDLDIDYKAPPPKPAIEKDKKKKHAHEDDLAKEDEGGE